MWPYSVARRMHLGQQRRAASQAPRSSSSLQAPAWMSNSSVREALLASVAWTAARRVAAAAAAGQHPDQPGVDGAEGKLAALGRGARAGHVVEQPGELGAGEVGVEDQPGLLAEAAARGRARFSASHAGAVRRSCQTMALASGSPVLRFQTQRRLALVGDADRGDVAGGRRRPAASASRAVASCDSQISRGSCSTQPGFGKDLPELALRHGDDGSVGGEDTMLRELEVPWSRASRCVFPVMGAPLRPSAGPANAGMSPLRAAGQGSWALLAGDAVDARLGEQLGKRRGRRRVGEQACRSASRRASSTIAGRLNLLWSAASQTSRECSMIARATFTSR